MKKYQDLLKGIAYVGQFGFTIVSPPIVMALLGSWLQRRLGLGSWIMIVCIVSGLLAAGSSAWSFFKSLDREASQKEKDYKDSVNYSDHR